MLMIVKDFCTEMTVYRWVSEESLHAWPSKHDRVFEIYYAKPFAVIVFRNTTWRGVPEIQLNVCMQVLGDWDACRRIPFWLGLHHDPS